MLNFLMNFNNKLRKLKRNQKRRSLLKNLKMIKIMIMNNCLSMLKTCRFIKRVSSSYN